MKPTSKKEHLHKDEPRRTLRRSRTDKMVAGVIGGIAEYFSVDSAVVRIIAILLLLAVPGQFLLFYLVAAIVIPESDKNSSGKPKERADGSTLFGIILILLGLSFLFSKYLTLVRWHYVLPFLLISFGIYLIVRR